MYAESALFFVLCSTPHVFPSVNQMKFTWYKPRNFFIYGVGIYWEGKVIYMVRTSEGFVDSSKVAFFFRTLWGRKFWCINCLYAI